MKFFLVFCYIIAMAYCAAFSVNDVTIEIPDSMKEALDTNTNVDTTTPFFVEYTFVGDDGKLYPIHHHTGGGFTVEGKPN